MTYKELQRANAEIKTTDIKGKEYAEVNQRIKAFRMLFPNGSIVPKIEDLRDGICVMKATVADENGTILAVGHAYEKEGSTFINKTSYIENCETSAVGRALGMLGIGIDTSVASYEEVANARAQQETNMLENQKISEIKVKALLARCERESVPVQRICELYKITEFSELTEKQYVNIAGNWKRIKEV